MCTTRWPSNWHPYYINQFTYAGRIKRVYIQADAPYRMGTDAFQHLFTPTAVL